MRRSSVCLVGLSLLAVACGKEPAPRAEPTASATSVSSSPSESPSASPTPTAPPTVTAGAVFYSDTFKDRSKGWTERSNENATYVVHTDYASPVYTVTANKPSVHLFPHPEFRGVTREQLTDYEITATIQSTLQVGREDWFGVTCRDLDEKRYSFEMGLGTSGGETRDWVIAKHDGGKLDVLAKGTHDVGGSAWDVSGACVGGSDGTPATLVMKINDEVVGYAVDSDAPLAQGYGGVYLFGKKGKTTINVLSFAARSASLG
jgi:hypothetical protein